MNIPNDPYAQTIPDEAHGNPVYEQTRQDMPLWCCGRNCGRNSRVVVLTLGIIGMVCSTWCVLSSKYFNFVSLRNDTFYDPQKAQPEPFEWATEANVGLFKYEVLELWEFPWPEEDGSQVDLFAPPTFAPLQRPTLPPIQSAETPAPTLMPIEIPGVRHLQETGVPVAIPTFTFTTPAPKTTPSPAVSLQDQEEAPTFTFTTPAPQTAEPTATPTTSAPTVTSPPTTSPSASPAPTMTAKPTPIESAAPSSAPVAPTPIPTEKPIVLTAPPSIDKANTGIPVTESPTKAPTTPFPTTLPSASPSRTNPNDQIDTEVGVVKNYEKGLDQFDQLFRNGQLGAMLAPIFAFLGTCFGLIELCCCIYKCSWLPTAMFLYLAFMFQNMTLFLFMTDDFCKYSQDCKLLIAGYLSAIAVLCYLISSSLICCSPRPTPCFKCCKKAPVRKKKKKKKPKDGEGAPDDEDDNFLNDPNNNSDPRRPYRDNFEDEDEDDPYDRDPYGRRVDDNYDDGYSYNDTYDNQTYGDQTYDDQTYDAGTLGDEEIYSNDSTTQDKSTRYGDPDDSIYTDGADTYSGYDDADTYSGYDDDDTYDDYQSSRRKR